MAEVKLPGTTPAYDKTEKAIRVLFNDGIPKLIDKIISAVPYLGYPVIKQIFVFILTKILQLAYKYSEQGIALLIIQNRVEAEREAYDKAVQVVRTEISQGGMSEAAKQEFERRLRDLIRIPSP